MENILGQDITGFPFDKAHKFASEERRVLDAIMGGSFGVVRGVDSEFKCTSNQLKISIAPGLIFAKGGWFKTTSVIEVSAPTSSTGWLVAQVDLTQANSSVGNIDDGTYQYLLNQVSFKLITENPIQEDILTAGARFDVPLASYVSSATAVTLKDARPFLHNNNPVGVKEYIGAIGVNWAGVRLTAPMTTAQLDAKVIAPNVTAFSDTGYSTIDTKRFAGMETRLTGFHNGSAALIIDNGALNSKTNTGKYIVLEVGGIAEIVNSGGDAAMNGTVRTLYKMTTSTTWPTTWTTQYDSHVPRAAKTWRARTPLRKGIVVVPPGSAVAMSLLNRIQASVSGASWWVEGHAEISVYLTDTNDFKNGKFG